MSQSEDIDAINTYIVGLSSKATGQAANLIAAWKVYFNDLGWFDKSLSSDTYNEVRAKRDAINAAMGFANLKDQGYDALTTEQLMDQNTAFAKMPANKISAPAGISVHATIKNGSSGADVVAWQKIIGVKADGKFLSGTTAATRTWQQQHGLPADGIVGPATWAKATGNQVASPEQVATATGFAPTPKPISTTPVATTAKPTTAAPVVSAGILSSIPTTLTNLSTPAKVGFGIALFAGIATTFKKHGSR